MIAKSKEVMSLNQQLQSTNEELQSLNEELTKVNSQLNDKVGELTETNNNMANLLGVTEIATIFLDTRLHIRRYTPLATQLLNFIDSDIGSPLGHITQNFTGIDLKAAAHDVLRTISPIEKEVQTPDGRWYTIRILPNRTMEDRIDGIVVTFFDVTRLKRLEQQRLELESQKLHAQKLESLGVLAGGIAHDFNNILTAVLGNTELALLESGGGERTREYIEDARKCALRAAELANQMLAYSGKAVISLHSVNLNEIIQDMVRPIEASISKNVSLQYQLEAALPPVRADATQLRQVVLNLLVNASEASDAGEGAITITTSKRRFSRSELARTFVDSDLSDGDYVSLEVTDTGCGMDSITMFRACEPFFSTKFTGRGLGLAAVMGIVKGHKGAISVRSEVGAGTVFTVIFPEDKVPEPSLVQADEVPFTLPEGSGTILVINDKIVRNYMTAILRKTGYKVLNASDGAEGVAIFKKHCSEIRGVLLDVSMPGMKTRDVLTELRAIRPDIPVLLCKGDRGSDISKRYPNNKDSDLAEKPFKMGALLSCIERCF